MASTEEMFNDIIEIIEKDLQSPLIERPSSKLDIGTWKMLENDKELLCEIGKPSEFHIDTYFYDSMDLEGIKLSNVTTDECLVKAATASSLTQILEESKPPRTQENKEIVPSHTNILESTASKNVPKIPFNDLSNAPKKSITLARYYAQLFRSQPEIYSEKQKTPNVEDKINFGTKSIKRKISPTSENMPNLPQSKSRNVSKPVYTEEIKNLGGSKFVILPRIKYNYRRILLAFCHPPKLNLNTIEIYLGKIDGFQDCKKKISRFFMSKKIPHSAFVLKFNTTDEADRANKILLEHQRCIRTIEASQIIEYTADIEYLHHNKRSTKVTVKCLGKREEQEVIKELIALFQRFSDVISIQRIQNENIISHIPELVVEIEYKFYSQALIAVIDMDQTYLSGLGKISVKFQGCDKSYYLTNNTHSFVKKVLSNCLGNA